MVRELLSSILVIILCCCVYQTDATINTETLIGCFPREYTFNATKTAVVNGRTLSCWDIVNVYSCWGRCISFEFGNYEMPYKISHHPVCTYTGKTSRVVRLENCHQDFPDPQYEVFDATGCACNFCNSETTSCENLNG